MMSFRCGVFQCPTSTGTEDFATGLPGIPTALFLQSAGSETPGTMQDAARCSHGATDGVTQWVASAGVANMSPVVDGDDIMDTSWSTTSIVRIIDHTGTVLAEAEFVSFNSDGSVTLDWTTAPATSIAIAFMAWDQVTALTGVNLIDTGVSQTVDVSSAIENLKCVLGANQRDVNDGTVSMGFGSSLVERGVGYAARVDISDNVEVASGDTAYMWTQAGTVGTGNGDFDQFTTTTFRIRVDNSGGPVFTDEPVGWLAIGDGGDWFPQPAPLRNPLDPNEPLPDDDQIPLGLVYSGTHQFAGGVPNEPHWNFTWGAWDNTDNQWVALNYLERDISGVRAATSGRIIYDDLVAVSFSNKATFSGSVSLTDDGAGGPHSTITGTQPSGIDSSTAALYFVYLEEGIHIQAWLV